MRATTRVAKGALGVLAVVAWIAVPLVVAAVVTARSERSVRTEPPASAWVAAGPVETEVSRTITAKADQEEQPPLLAPAWTGLVEEVGLRVGEPLRSGDTVAVIDGLPRLAAATGRPLRRSLVPGDRGQDVTDLNGWLASRRYEADAGDRFGRATRRGVLALRRDLGLAANVDEFDPAWLVFLAAPEVTVRSTTLQAGAPAPGAGTAIAELEPQITSVTLALADQSGAAPPGLGAPTGAPTDVPTGAPTEGAGTAPAGIPAGVPAGTPAPAGVPDATPPAGAVAQAPAANPLTAVAEGAVLRSGSEEVGPIGVDGSLSPETEAAVIRLLGEDSSAMLQLVEPAPAGSRALVANALFTGPSGAMCVAARTSPGARTTVHLVRQVGGTATQPLVAGAPDGDVEVQVNPPLAVRRQCRS